MRTLPLPPLLLVAATLFLHVPAAAQFGTSRATFTAPTAASLGRFGEVPVALYTGQPDISIPLTTVRGRELALPVTLRYQPGGVRVDEIGSWVGMGWALEAGGTITRTVRGIADDHPNGYWNTGHNFYNNANWPTPSSPVSLFQNMQGGYIDGEPDQFFFNFAGRTGQFVIGPTSASSTVKEVRTTPYQKLRIEPSNGFRTWTITTEDGTRYVFASADTTHDQSGTVQPPGSPYVAPPYSPDFISSWQLTEVQAPGGDVIRLYYTRYYARHQLANSGSQFDVMMSKPSWNGATCPTWSTFTHINAYEIKTQRLDSIKSAAHTVRFIPDATLRADALDPSGNRQEPRLAQIEVRTPAGTVVRRFVLDHDYFGGNRLRLKNVFEQDAAGSPLPPWTFEYDAQSFPVRGSFAQDHAGYWNGRSNGSLVPAQKTSYTLSDGTHQVSLTGANREPDAAYARVGTLSRITYPTGGSTAFGWELHEYGSTRYGTVTYDSAGPEQTAYASHNTYIPNSRTTTTTFTVSGSQPALVSLEVVQYCTLGMTSCAWAKITGPGVDQTYTAPATTGMTLAPGTYTLTATSPTSNQFSTATITVKWREVIRLTGRKPASGLRIAEVRTNDGHGTQQVRRYRYRLQSDTTRSSGVLAYEPVYGEWIDGDGCTYFSRTASSNLPLGASAALTYREVTVIHGENGEFGRTRETFRNVIDNPDNAPSVPRPNLRITSWEGRQGQRLTGTETSAAGLVQQRTRALYTFRMDEPTTFRRFRGMSLSRFSYNAGYLDYAYNAFEVISEWNYLSTDSVFTYDDAGTSAVHTTRGYTYGNPVHAQVTQLTETSSDGTQRITRTRYPADYADAPPSSDPDGLGDGEAYAYAMTQMKGPLHIHSPVVERWVSEVAGGTERVLQAEITGYQAFPTVLGRSYLPAMRFVLSAPGPVTDFTPASVVNGWLVWDESRFRVREQLNGYDSWGRVREVVDANDAVYTYTYGGNANNAFLTQISRQPSGGGVTLVSSVGYDASGNVASMQDEGGALRTFTYDGYGRLRQVRNAAGTLLRGYGYTHSRTAANGWTYQPGAPNAVADTAYAQHSPTVLRGVSTAYADGLGRTIQTVAEDGGWYHVTARQYDARGGTWRLWRPYTRTTPGFDAGFAAGATSYYNTQLGVGSAKPYTDSLFTADPLARPRSVVPEYVGAAPPSAVTLAYGVDTGTGQRYTETTDEMGKKRRVYADGFGNAVRTILGYGAAEATTTSVAYNALGQQTQLTDARGIVTQYVRDTRGLVTARTSPDAGNRGHKYDRAGNLRYAQDANQAAAGQVHFTSYDFAGRPLVSGVGTASFAALDAASTSAPALETTTSNWREVRAYDSKPSTTVFPWSLFATQLGPLALNNATGRVAATASSSGGAWQADFYSYDADGKLAARYTFHHFGGGVVTTLNTTIGYTRDLRDAVTQRSLTVGASSFYQWYAYDGRGLLSHVYASTQPTRPATADAAYTYEPGGRVAQRQFQGGPLVPLRYTIRGQLELIGDPASAAFPFSARYSYHPNGRMQESEFYSAGAPVAEKRYGYVFGTASWDALNRLRSADYSGWTGAGWNGAASHDLYGIQYDAAGNLTAMGRYNQAGAVIDNLAYGYGAGSNRLASMTDYTGATAETWDAETGGFAYDANGNVTATDKPYNISSATYDHRNLPISITAGGVTTGYHYTVDGQRYARRPAAGGGDIYIKEGSATLAVFTVNLAATPTAWHFNLLAGDQVIGRQPGTGNRRYYHRDLLGSTRAVVEGATVVESYDYDPFGLLLPGRTLNGPTRERYTGREQDAETGLHYFGARYYMAALGRWTSVDPGADAFPAWSPYNYVEGNPVSFTDPYGLCKKDKNGQEDPACLLVIRLLLRAAQDAERGRPASFRSHFRDAADIYRRTSRDVQFVRASEWASNKDGNNRTFVLGQTHGVGGPIRIRRDLGEGDIVATATHEAVIHAEDPTVNGLGMHFGDTRPETTTINREIWDQLPGRLRPSGELWRRKLCIDDRLSIHCSQY